MKKKTILVMLIAVAILFISVSSATIAKPEIRPPRIKTWQGTKEEFTQHLIEIGLIDWYTWYLYKEKA